jgi:chloramphenicol 3-O-phosphotransferase
VESQQDQPKVILVTGVMASGKSTVGELVAQELKPSVHLRGDVFRKTIVNGRQEMGFAPSDAAVKQLWLRYRISHQVALGYWRAGFNVVYQDVVIGRMLQDVVELYRGLPLHVVVLSPRAEVVALREAGRSKKGYSSFTVGQLFDMFSETPRLGLWVDNSEQSVVETATCVLGSLKGARINWT